MSARAKTIAGIALLVTSVASIARADLSSVPAKTTLRLHLRERIASNVTKVGSRFAFAMVEPVVVAGTTIVAKDALGQGTVLVAGHAGTQGHEGDLTLRFDSVSTVDGRRLVFDDQRARINGRNRKAASFFGGFIPFVGMGAGFIRGADIAIEPTTVIENVLERSAAIVASIPPELPSAAPGTGAAATPGPPTVDRPPTSIDRPPSATRRRARALHPRRRRESARSPRHALRSRLQRSEVLGKRRYVRCGQPIGSLHRVVEIASHLHVQPHLDAGSDRIADANRHGGRQGAFAAKKRLDVGKRHPDVRRECGRFDREPLQKLFA